jgi:branched-chain amino acid transport system permease protein
VNVRRALVPLAVIAVIAAAPWVFPSPYYLNAMIFIGINALLATGLNWVLGYTGLVSLGQAGFYGLGAYASAILATRLGWPVLVSVIGAVTLTALAAWVIGTVAVRLRGHHLAMATLGFGVILQILFEQMAGLTGGPKGLVGIPALAAFGVEAMTDVHAYYVIWSAVAACTLLSANLSGSRIGRALRAIEADELAARASGVPVRRIKIVAFVLGSALGGFAGALYAHYVGFISPGSFGFMLSVELVVVVIVGGRGSLIGPIVGAAVFTALPEYLRAYREYDVVLFGAVLILVLMFVPRGLAGAMSDLGALLRRRRIAHGSPVAGS